MVLTRARLGGGLILLGLVGLGGALFTRGIGFSARGMPSGLETRLAYGARRWAIPASVRSRPNPVEASAEVIDAGLSHWADHCALCHDNDGSGRTTIGRSFYPPAPDMRTGRSQQLSDGELFYVIEHGIPFTGMPAWGNGTPGGERASWELVRFIRHLPDLTPEDIGRMETLNPKSAAHMEAEQLMQDFLKGGGDNDK